MPKKHDDKGNENGINSVRNKKERERGKPRRLVFVKPSMNPVKALIEKL